MRHLEGDSTSMLASADLWTRVRGPVTPPQLLRQSKHPPALCCTCPALHGGREPQPLVPPPLLPDQRASLQALLVLLSAVSSLGFLGSCGFWLPFRFQPHSFDTSSLPPSTLCTGPRVLHGSQEPIHPPPRLRVPRSSTRSLFFFFSLETLPASSSVKFPCKKKKPAFTTITGCGDVRAGTHRLSGNAKSNQAFVRGGGRGSALLCCSRACWAAAEAGGLRLPGLKSTERNDPV